MPKSRSNEVLNFVQKGLKDLSVSRTSFSWGIQVPENKKHVIYVWLDALTNYISAINFPNTNDSLFKKFWPASVHIIGKDILRFHAVYWPAFLMAAKIELPKRIFGHGWILSDDKKMSKSLGNILDPLDIIEKYGIDQLRYYLIKEVSLGNDGSISLENLKNCINNDLANNYGNLCQRVLSFIKKNTNNCVPKCNKLEKKDITLLNDLKNEIPNLKKLINDQELNIYLKKIIDFSFDSNKYFNDSEPWKLKKDNSERMNTILFVITEQIKNISILLSPIIPLATKKILDNLNILLKDRTIDSINQPSTLNHDKPLKDPEILFSKIEDDS
jgi:methionyl-tRNA synthetase